MVEFNLRYEFPNLNIQPFFADYTQSLPPLNENQKRIYFLFGNRIGNLEPFQAQAIFYRIGQSMKKNDELLIGVDMVKDSNIMVKAYRITSYNVCYTKLLRFIIIHSILIKHTNPI